MTARPDRRPWSLRTRGAVACTLGWVLPVVLLAGCSDDVDLDAPDLSADEGAACADVVAGLPDTVAGEERRSVSPEDAPGGAWGDPALTLVCGTSMPGSFDDFSQCSVVDGVQWYVPEDGLEDPGSDVTIYSLGYEPVIAVRVPATYRPSADAVMAELGPVVRRRLERVHRCT